MLNAISSSFNCSWVKVVLCLLLVVGVRQECSLLPPLAVEPLLCWPWFIKLKFPVLVLICCDWETIAAATARATSRDALFGFDEFGDDEDVEEEEDDDDDDDEDEEIGIIWFVVFVKRFIPKLLLFEKLEFTLFTIFEAAVIKRPFDISCLTFLNAPSWYCWVIDAWVCVEPF